MVSVLEGFSDRPHPNIAWYDLDLIWVPKICFVGLGTFQVLLDFIAFSTQKVKISKSQIFKKWTGAEGGRR